MATSTYNSSTSIVSDGLSVKLEGLSLDIKSINSRLSNLFYSYSILLNKINGGDIFTADQIRQIQDLDGVSVKQCQGRIVVKNDIDNLQYLLDNRSSVASTLGFTSSEIYSNRRNYEFIYSALSRLNQRYELGNQADDIQLYISKHDANIGELDSLSDWVDYILTKNWIRKIVSQSQLSEASHTSDYRLSHIANIVSGLMVDHEQAYHSEIDSFDETQYLDSYQDVETKSENLNTYIEAYDKLNSFNNLNYGFYEIFKPIGGSTEKYIKVKVSSNGMVDIQGVLQLTDCVEVPWEHGSREYLQALNTGNTRYQFRLDAPFNDDNSKLYWKPDDSELIVDLTEQIEEDDQETDSTSSDIEEIDSTSSDFDHPYAISGILQDALYEIVQPTLHQTFNKDEDDPYAGIDADDMTDDGEKWRYYKEYEAERFLRWFGSTSIPKIDLTSITKKTICSIPKLSSDTQSEKFFDDSNNISENMELARGNFDESTSLTLLSLAKKATIDIIGKTDSDGNLGQYLQFIVSGHQQTYAISFHITAQILKETVSLDGDGNYIRSHNIEEINHYGHTLKKLDDTYRLISNNILYLDLTRQLNNDAILDTWKLIKGDEDFIPEDWYVLRSQLETLGQLPTAIDLIRLRQLDFNAIDSHIKELLAERDEFLEKMSADDVSKRIDYVTSQGVDVAIGNTTVAKYSLVKFQNNNLVELRDTNTFNDKKLTNLCLAAGLSETIAGQVVQSLNYILDSDKYGIEDVSAFETTLDVLRERIQTFNNLIVRLPTKTRTNRIISLHIFQDWKNFVDKSIQYLIGKELLLPQDEQLIPGTDSNLDDSSTWHKVIPYKYLDESGKEQDFIDYSYCYEYDSENPTKITKVLHDRWDMWSEQDFIKDTEKYLLDN